MADPVPPSVDKTPRPPVLVLTNDSDLGTAKTSRHVALALGRLGFHAVVRDTRLNRWGAEVAREDAVRRDAFEVAVVAKWAKLIEDYGIRLVLSLDLHWLLSRHLFVNDANVRRIHSFWIDAAPATPTERATFPLEARELIGAEKVVHHGSTDGQIAALQKLGAKNLRRFVPGAPAEYLRAGTPYERSDRLGFVGEPTPEIGPLVGRLARRGWLDVHGSPEAWRAFGVPAQSLPPFAQLPALYRRYPALLNLGADRQLFDVAACGRVSLAMDRPALSGWYEEGEIRTCANEDALIAAAEAILRDPDAALAAGERARSRTARDHLWENRLESALA